MSLQTRLFAFFIAIVVLPLGLVALLGQRIIVNELEQRTLAQLDPASTAAGAVYQARFVVARDRVQLIANSTEVGTLIQQGRFGQLTAVLEDRLGSGDRETQIDYIVVADPRGDVLASVLTEPDFLEGVDPPTASDIVAGASTGEEPETFMVTRSIVPITVQGSGRQIATVVGGYYLDNRFVENLSQGTGVDASLFISGRAVSTTVPDVTQTTEQIEVDLSQAIQQGFIETEMGGQPVFAIPTRLGEDIQVTEAALVMTTLREPIARLSRSIRNYLIVLLLFAAAGSALLGFSLARVIARPLKQLSAGANAIAAGNYDQHIEVRSSDEMGQLANAFNEMAERLSVHISELKESREELKRALTRFAQTLRSTHDLDGMVEMILDTSMDTLDAAGGAVMWMSSSRDSLEATLARGIEEETFSVEVGAGLTGTVAKTGEPIRFPDGDDVPEPCEEEPRSKTALSVPIFSQERVIAVLNLYDKHDGLDFTEADMGTLLSLADQAGVAIENVLLHEETKRQAITDGLTQVWNYRYFQHRYEQEIERSARFHRPFSLIVLDIDDFKPINDTYGHQRGDAVLVELAERVGNEVRDIDVLARYGGEEFLVILPETDAEGGLRTAEKIREAIGAQPFLGEPPIEVTVSLGVACFPEHGKDPSELQRNADLAMYQAKAAGKNCTVVYRRPAA